MNILIHSGGHDYKIVFSNHAMTRLTQRFFRGKDKIGWESLKKGEIIEYPPSWVDRKDADLWLCSFKEHWIIPLRFVEANTFWQSQLFEETLKKSTIKRQQ